MPEAENVQPGVSIILEPEPNKITSLFSDLVSDGRKGLYLTRQLPADVKQRPKKGSVRYVWMSKVNAGFGAEDAFAIGSRIERFLEECEGGVVAVDCVGYPPQAGGGKSLADMLDAVSRKALRQKAYVLFQMPGESLREEEREMLAKATGNPILERGATR